MERDAHESHGDTDAENLDRVSEVPQRRPPITFDEYRNPREKEHAANSPCFPQKLQVVVVRPIPALSRARRCQGCETVLEGSQAGPEPDKRRKLSNDALPDDRPHLEGGLCRKVPVSPQLFLDRK